VSAMGGKGTLATRPWYGYGAGYLAGAIIGSSYYSLPYGCPEYAWSGYSYYHCYGDWYLPQYEGDTVVYVTVPDPTNGQATGQTPTAQASQPQYPSQ